MTLTMYQFPEIIILLKCYNLTEVAGEGGPDLARQKFLLSLFLPYISGTKLGKQILFTFFLHLMRCLNSWDNKKFWGAKSGPPSPATSVKLPRLIYR